MPPATKPLAKQAWLWILISGLVAGGVTTGAVVGAKATAQHGFSVDGDDFSP
jgi:hypothetical protein